MSISTDEMQFNEIDEVFSKTFFYKNHYDCADVYIWSGQICIGKDFLKKIINSCNDKDIKNILSQTLDDRETYQNVIPRYDMEKVAKRESYERFWGYNKIKKENEK
jgi:hypothetical protein